LEILHLKQILLFLIESKSKFRLSNQIALGSVEQIKRYYWQVLLHLAAFHMVACRIVFSGVKALMLKVLPSKARGRAKNVKKVTPKSEREGKKSSSEGTE
jgi:hypothetical protein